MTTKYILVTGGAGFIGSNLCRKLLEDERNEVICVDNLYSGRRENIAALITNPRFQFILGDVCDTNAFNFYNTIHEIYHLACPASPPFYQADPIGTLKTCTIGTINMLELAAKYNAKLLYTSTSEIYGDPLEHPQRESYRGNVNPIGIRSCYDEGKRVGETLCIEYHRTRGVDTKICRIFNTYGPYLNAEDGRVVSNFIIQALKNEPITIYGHGEQTRSFCYVDDLVRGLIALMTSNHHMPVNLGNPNELTVYDLAKQIKELTNSSSDIVIKAREMPEDDPKVRKPDISLANEVLNWQATVCLSDGLLETIKYFNACTF
jgi:UDP-glucuronate decarboxylase